MSLHLVPEILHPAAQSIMALLAGCRHKVSQSIPVLLNMCRKALAIPATWISYEALASGYQPTRYDISGTTWRASSVSSTMLTPTQAKGSPVSDMWGWFAVSCSSGNSVLADTVPPQDVQYLATSRAAAGLGAGQYLWSISYREVLPSSQCSGWHKYEPLLLSFIFTFLSDTLVP